MDDLIEWGSKLKFARGSLQGKADTSVDDCLSYVREIDGYVFDVTYFFVEKKLTFITYEYADFFDDDDEALAAWDALSRKISSQFGPALREVERSRSSIDENDLAFWSPLQRVLPFRWAAYRDNASQAVLVLEGTSQFFLGLKAELSPLAPAA